MTNYSHSKCYANALNNCSTKISGEHIMSDNILELFEQDKSVKVTGLPFIEKETFNLLSRKSLVANILCTNHNEQVSKYDSEAGKLFRSIIQYDNDFNDINPKTELIKINGDYIEKWMVKIICGVIASKQIASNGVRINAILKNIYIDTLFNNIRLPKEWGLYFKIPDNHIIHKYNCASVLPMTADNEVKAAEFLINNFKFIELGV